MIYVTKTYLPSREKIDAYFDSIYDSRLVTNQGPLSDRLEVELAKYHSLSQGSLKLVGNGTIALQLAINALGLSGNIITTPFSYVATVNSIIWERCRPIFADVYPETGNINISSISDDELRNASAVMPVHVFGNPCDIDEISDVSQRFNLRVIYDAAHAFGVKFKGNSILMYGDCSTLSFHATKLFHTIEGGACITTNQELSEKIRLLRSFGHSQDNYYYAGINGKNSEVHSAFGLALLDEIDIIIERRKTLSCLYDELLDWSRIKTIEYNKNGTRNYAYYPIVLESEKMLFRCLNALGARNVYPRRYFYPSLNKLSYLQDTKSCPVSEDLANRILCLPLYPDLSEESVEMIAKVINSSL